MDHLGSGGSSNNPYSQGEPFFDLLQQPSVPSVPTAPTSRPSPPVYFANNDDVLLPMDFMEGKSKPDEGAVRGWTSQPANSRNLAPSYDLNVRSEKDVVETATVAAVERTMKKYADNLLRVLEGMSGRLAQLESNSSRMEHSVDKIKVEAADNFGVTDGKLRSLENMIREVQRSVQVIRDKQEIAEEQMKLEKLQLSAKRESRPSAASTPAVETKEAPLALPAPASVVEIPPAPAAPVVQQQPQQVQQVPQLAQLPQQVQQPAQLPHQQLPVLSSQHQQPQMQGPPPQHQHLHPQGPQHQQLQAQGLPQQQMQMQGMMPQQQLQLQGPPQAPPQSPQAPPPHLQQHQQLQLQAPNEAQYQAPPVAPPHSSQMQPFYAQQQQHPGQPGPAPAMYGNPNPEVNPYGASQGSYSQEVPPQVPGGYELRFLPLPPPPPSSSMQQTPATQHGQGGGQMFDSPRNPPGPYHPQAHPQAHPPQGRDSPQAYNQYAPAHYRTSPAPSAQGGGYQQLPTARPVQPPQGGAPGPVANRVPVEEVIDKVAGMGFGRDQVRAVVRRLTENGTSVDLNVVLDKLMNGDSSSRNEGQQQPAKGWYGR